jgi:hypothetical protein
MKGIILGFHSIVEGDVRSGLSAKELCYWNFLYSAEHTWGESGQS